MPLCPRARPPPPPPPRACRRHDTFCIRMGAPEVLVNDDRTRTFLVLAAGGGGGGAVEARGGSKAGETGSGGVKAALAGGQAGGQQQNVRHGGGQQALPPPLPRYSPALVSLCHAVSGVFAAHGLPRFYAEPRPHVSGGCRALRVWRLWLRRGKCKAERGSGLGEREAGGEQAL